MRVQSWGRKGVSMHLANPELDLFCSRFVTKTFWKVQRREVKFGDESLLQIKPNGGETQKSNRRLCKLEETFRISESHQLFSFTDGETQVQRWKEVDTISQSNPVSELRPEPTPFSPSLGAFHVPQKRMRGQHSSLLGWGADGGGISLELWLVLISRSCPPTEL